MRPRSQPPARIFHRRRVARATRPCRRATGPAEWRETCLCPGALGPTPRHTHSVRRVAGRHRLVACATHARADANERSGLAAHPRSGKLRPLPCHADFPRGRGKRHPRAGALPSRMANPLRPVTVALRLACPRPFSLRLLAFFAAILPLTSPRPPSAAPPPARACRSPANPVDSKSPARSPPRPPALPPSFRSRGPS